MMAEQVSVGEGEPGSLDLFLTWQCLYLSLLSAQGEAEGSRERRGQWLSGTEQADAA